MLPAWVCLDSRTPSKHCLTPGSASYRWLRPHASTQLEVEWDVWVFGAGQNLEKGHLSLLLGLFPAAGSLLLSQAGIA